jgi:DNA-binding transcriptional ArsR family regulator
MTPAPDSPTRAAILEAVREAENGITMTELQAALGMCHATIVVHVNALAASKQVQKVGERPYMRIYATGAAVTPKAKKAKEHVCYISPYTGFCFGCRYKRKREEYKTERWWGGKVGRITSAAPKNIH